MYNISKPGIGEHRHYGLHILFLSVALQMWNCLCQMCSSPRATAPSPAPARRPRGPLPPRLPGATVHTAAEEPGTTATDQVIRRQPHAPSHPCGLTTQRKASLTGEMKFTHVYKVFLWFPFCRPDIHTEAVKAALAKHKEEKMALPMPTKRRSAFVQSPVDNCTPPGTVYRNTLIFSQLVSF